MSEGGDEGSEPGGLYHYDRDKSLIRHDLNLALDRQVQAERENEQTPQSIPSQYEPFIPAQTSIDQPTHEQTYLFVLGGTFVFSLISFSIISSASFTSKILKEGKVAYHGWYTDDGRISYSDSTALGFSVGGGVIVWLGSMAILYFRLSGGSYLTYNSSIRSIFVGLHYFTLLFAYTSAIACSSISADLVADDWFDDDDDYDDDSAKKIAKQERQLEDDLKAFNEKIRAGCCFAWFATITMLVASIIVARASACTCDENRAVEILKGTDMPFSSPEIVVGWNRHVNTRGGGFGDPNAPLPNAPLPPPQQLEAPSSAIL